jgi:hypothetical protein
MQRDLTYSSVSSPSFHIVICDLPTKFSSDVTFIPNKFCCYNHKVNQWWPKAFMQTIHTVSRISILESNLLNGNVRIIGSTNLILYLNGWNAIKQSINTMEQGPPSMRSQQPISWARNSPPLTENCGILRVSQELATSPNSEPNESTTTRSQSILLLCSHLRLVTQTVSSLLVSKLKVRSITYRPCACYIPRQLHPTWFKHNILTLWTMNLFWLIKFSVSIS